MRVIAVDDEQLALEDLARRLRAVPEIAEVAAFSAPLKALDWLADHPVEIAFLDVSMGSMDGLTLAKRLKELQPACAVVFVSGYSEYAVGAYQMHASGYLLKPATEEDIRREIAYILSPPPLCAQSRKAIRIRCFGNFEVFIRGAPAKFRYSKSKELLAYLTDRHGSAVDMGALCAVLWEDKPDGQSLRSQLRNSISDLTLCAREAGVRDLLCKQKNRVAVNVDAVDCDYFSFLRMDPGSANSYRGEYMTQYSWAEITLGSLERMRNQA